jgi:ABC-type glycerol-3-phosphate transport system substrate-binding protein
LQDTLTSATGANHALASPPLTSVYQSTAYQKRFGFDDYIPTVVQTIQNASENGVSPIKGDPNYLPGTPEWSSIGQRVVEQLSRAITGQATPEEAIAKAAVAVESP